MYSEINKFNMRHSFLTEKSNIDFFVQCCERYAEKGGRYAENYTESKIKELIRRGRINEGVLYLYYGDEVVAFTGLESYNGKEALMATRLCVYNPSPVPYGAFFLVPKVLEMAREKGYKHAAGSVNESNKNLVKLMMSGESKFNNTPFEKYKHMLKDCFDNFFVGEKQTHNGVEQQFYFIKV